MQSGGGVKWTLQASTAGIACSLLAHEQLLTSPLWKPQPGPRCSQAPLFNSSWTCFRGNFGLLSMDLVFPLSTPCNASPSAHNRGLPRSCCWTSWRRRRHSQRGKRVLHLPYLILPLLPPFLARSAHRNQEHGLHQGISRAPHG